MEALLNSTVLTATVTAVGAILLTVVTYYLSTKKKAKHSKPKPTENPSTYAGYEALLRQYKEEIERLYSVAKDREELIAKLRVEQNMLYEEIEKKNKEISWLRHKREYMDEAFREKGAL